MAMVQFIDRASPSRPFASPRASHPPFPPLANLSRAGCAGCGGRNPNAIGRATWCTGGTKGHHPTLFLLTQVLDSMDVVVKKGGTSSIETSS